VKGIRTVGKEGGIHEELARRLLEEKSWNDGRSRGVREGRREPKRPPSKVEAESEMKKREKNRPLRGHRQRYQRIWRWSEKEGRKRREQALCILLGGRLSTFASRK